MALTETLAAVCWFFTLAFASTFGTLLALYLLCFTYLRLLIVLYLVWIWIDRKTCDRGGRRCEWVRNWKLWKYVQRYFSFKMTVLPSLILDRNRNYLFCCFPHGVLPLGAFMEFSTTAGSFTKIFPHHKPHILTITYLFMAPFYREFMLAVGACSVSVNSIKYLMGAPTGGNAAALVVGGIEEAYYSRPGDYHVVLRKRKGFIKLALQTGCSLVPVFSFGEIDVFDQIDSPEGSVLRRIQVFIKNILGMPPALMRGCGLLGLVPHKVAVNLVVGKPIDVVRNANPNEEDINGLHTNFVESLTNLFEQHKHKYARNPESTKLVIH